jgi:hypothetical protein
MARSVELPGLLAINACRENKYETVVRFEQDLIAKIRSTARIATCVTGVVCEPFNIIAESKRARVSCRQYYVYITVRASLLRLLPVQD